VRQSRLGLGPKRASAGSALGRVRAPVPGFPAVSATGGTNWLSWWHCKPRSDRWSQTTTLRHTLLLCNRHNRSLRHRGFRDRCARIDWAGRTLVWSKPSLRRLCQMRWPRPSPIQGPACQLYRGRMRASVGPYRWVLEWELECRRARARCRRQSGRRTEASARR